MESRICSSTFDLPVWMMGEQSEKSAMAYYRHSYGRHCRDVPGSPIFSPENIRRHGIPCYNGLPPLQPPPPLSRPPPPLLQPPLRPPQPRYELENTQFSHYPHRDPTASSSYIPVLWPIPHRDNSFESRPHPPGVYVDHRSRERFDVENWGLNSSPVGDGRRNFEDREFRNGSYPFKEVDLGYQGSHNPYEDGFGRIYDTSSFIFPQTVHRGVANDIVIRDATNRHVQCSEAATSTAFRRIQNRKCNCEDKYAWHSNLWEAKDSKMASDCRIQADVKGRSSLYVNMSASNFTDDFDNGLKHKISNIYYPSAATENFFLVNPTRTSVKEAFIYETSSSCRTSPVRDLKELTKKKKKKTSMEVKGKLMVPNWSSLNSQSEKKCAKSENFKEVVKEEIIPNSDSQLKKKSGKTKKLNHFTVAPISSTDLTTVVAPNPVPAAAVRQDRGSKDALLVANKDEIEGPASATDAVLKKTTSISDAGVPCTNDSKSTHGESSSFANTFNSQERATFSHNDSTNCIILLDKSGNNMFSVSQGKDNPSKILNMHKILEEEPKLDSEKLQAIDMQFEHDGQLSASCTETPLMPPFKSSNQMDMKDFDDDNPKNVDLEPSVDEIPNLKRPVSVAFDAGECGSSPFNKRERKLPSGSESLPSTSKIDDQHDLAVSNPQLPDSSKSSADPITNPIPFMCGNGHDDELAFIADAPSDGISLESLLDVCHRDKMSFEKPHIQSSSSLPAAQRPWIQPLKAMNRKIQSVSSFHPDSSSFSATSSTHKTNPQTWHREDHCFSSAPLKSYPSANSISSTSQVAKADAKLSVVSYVRKGNSLVRKPALDAARYQKSHGRNSIVYQLDPSGSMEPKESADFNGKSETSDSFGAPSEPLMVTAAHQYDSDSAVLSDLLNRNLNENKALFRDGYFRKKNHQLIRNSSKSETSQTGDLPVERLNSEEQPDPDVIPVRKFSKRLAGKGVKKSKAARLSKLSMVWTLRNTQLSQNHNLSLQKFVPILCPWKKATYWRTWKSDSYYGKNLMQSRKKNSVYTRPKHVLSPRKSKILCVGGSSLMAKKAVKEDAMEIAATARNKRKHGSALSSVSQIKDTSGEQIFHIGLVSYRMDSSGQTLQRISDGELSGSEGSQEEKRKGKFYVPRRLVIGNDEYVRIGNGNQLVRDPKRRVQSLASEKLRWSLHTARSRLAKGRKFCQFFTRFGKCNKKNGKCPFLHDPSKISVCTKFLNDSCFDSDCRLTHEIIPERMPDCSFFLQGLCTNTICHYRHVHVNPNASTCDGFLRGYCTRGNECTKKHTYVCPDFEAGGRCPHGSKCKLHHPKEQSRGNERKKKKMKMTSHPKTNEIGRYFGADNVDLSNSDLAVLDSPSTHCHDSPVCGADYISFDVVGDGEDDDDQGSSSDEETGFANAHRPELLLRFGRLDEQIKPVRIMNI